MKTRSQVALKAMLAAKLLFIPGIIEMTPGKIVDLSATCDEYLRSQGSLEKSRAA